MLWQKQPLYELQSAFRSGHSTEIHSGHSSETHTSDANEHGQ